MTFPAGTTRRGFLELLTATGAALVLGSTAEGEGQGEDDGYDIARKSDVMVRMRDGVHLATDIYLPVRNGQPWKHFPRRTCSSAAIGFGSISRPAIFRISTSTPTPARRKAPALNAGLPAIRYFSTEITNRTSYCRWCLRGEARALPR
jgi:hypothetical protein